MAVAIIATDTWLSHLPFVGGPRRTSFGDVDGIFYGVVSGTGDGSGGNFTLNGNISFDKKEDWIYVIGGTSYSRNDVQTTVDAFEVIATGPLIPTTSAVANPSFHAGALMKGIVNNAVTIRDQSLNQPYVGMPVFGDKRITGPLSMYAVGFENNNNAVVYQMSLWGWIIRYNSFFRDIPPSRG